MSNPIPLSTEQPNKRKIGEFLTEWLDKRCPELNVEFSLIGLIVTTENGQTVKRGAFTDDLNSLALITDAMDEREMQTYLGVLYEAYEKQMEKGMWEFMVCASAPTRALAAYQVLKGEK